MKKPVKTVLISLVAAAAITCAADSPRDIAATRALVKEHARSAVAVEVRFKAPEGDESTGFNIPYMCPNCNRTHYNSLSDYVGDDSITTACRTTWGTTSRSSWPGMWWGRTA